MNRRRAALETICRARGVAILYCFGSRAREALAWLDSSEGELLPGPSDVDVGVKPLPGVKLRLRAEVGLTQALEEFLGVDRVDLVNLDSANPYLAAEIIHGERLYADDDYAADNYDLYVLRREADLAPLEEETARRLLRVDT